MSIRHYKYVLIAIAAVTASSWAWGQPTRVLPDRPVAAGDRVIFLPGVGEALSRAAGDNLRLGAGSPSSRLAGSRQDTAQLWHGPWFTAGEAAARSMVVAQLATLRSQPKIVVVFIPRGAIPTFSGSIDQLRLLLSDRRGVAFARQFMGTRTAVRGLTPSETSRANALTRVALVSAFSRSVVQTIASRWRDTQVIFLEGSEPLTPAAMTASWARSLPSSRVVFPAGAGAPQALANLAMGLSAKVPRATTAAPEAAIAQVSSCPGLWEWRQIEGGYTLWTEGVNAPTAPRTWFPGTVADRGDGANRLKPEVSVQQVVGGLRVTFRYSNPSAYTREMASMVLPAVMVGPNAIVQDLRHYGNATPLASGQAWTGNYPLQLYAPAAVIRNDRVAFGISVEYPVLDYRHDIGIALKPVDKDCWSGELSLENAGTFRGSSYLSHSPVLTAGESRSYTVNIICARSANWIETLAPYRSFLRKTYGPVAYARDLRPIAGLVFAHGEAQDASNPRGWARFLGDLEAQGHDLPSKLVESRFSIADRVVAWAPTGLSSSPVLNFPFHFASPLTTTAETGDEGPALAPVGEALRAIGKQPGWSYGLWWGHSASPRRSWSDATLVSAGGTSHAEFEMLSFRELDAAAAVGATTIGLDAFAHVKTPVWYLVPHLQSMRSRHPQMRFCTEGRAPDVLHMTAATWIDGFRWPRPSIGDGFQAWDRFVVADYLLPGHETWVGMQFDRSPDPSLSGPNPDRQRQEMYIELTVANGMVPVDWTGADVRTIYLRRAAPHALSAATGRAASADERLTVP